MNYFNKKTDHNGVSTLIFDTPNSSVNVLCFDALYELEQLLTELHNDTTIKMLFIQSAKSDIFIAGADINEIKAFKDEKEIFEKLSHGQAILNQIENLPYPTIAVIDGACLGGGLELAMACSYRIATNEARTRIGLVEVSLGIIPGLSGTQRLPKLVGFMKAIELITASKRLTGDKALKLGLVDASIPSGYLDFKKEEFIKEILAGTLAKKVAKKRKKIRWYEKLSFTRKIITSKAKEAVNKKTKGFYPAPLKAIELLEETLTMSHIKGSKKELEVFVLLAISQISKNLIEIFFTSERLKKETFSTVSPQTIGRSAVVGVGAMGSGIAWALSYKDVPVRLCARQMSSIARAVANMMRSYESLKKRRRLTSREIGLKMDRVTYTTSMRGFKQTSIVIEAVSESSVIKRTIFETLEKVVPSTTIIATNTSSLGISKLARGLEYPERFIGMHFFNPVAKMPLVEIIAGEKTSQETIASTVKLAKKLGKIPIKVSECVGFLVNRTLLPYLNESAKIFEEGESIEKMDTLLLSFGMPMGPFTLADEVGLDIGAKVSKILHNAYGKRMIPAKCLEAMTQKEWLGKKSKIGFYLYGKGAKTLNPKIVSFQYAQTTFDDDIILDRAILIMLNEAIKCLEEGVVENAQYLDMAMVMGIGFPAFRGGLLRYADTRGLEVILERLFFLKEQFGDRFTPANLLIAMVEKGKKFYEE